MGIWNAVTDVLFSSVTLTGVFAFICNFLNKRLEKHIDQKQEKGIEKFKSILESDNKLFLNDIEIRKHIIEDQYKRTIEDYPVIWQSIVNYVDASINYKDFSDAPRGNYESRNNEFIVNENTWKQARMTLEKDIMDRAPFYPEDHYNLFLEILKEGKDLYEYLKDKSFSYDVDESVLTDLKQKLTSKRDDALTAIRDYLKNFRLENINDPRSN